MDVIDRERRRSGYIFGLMLITAGISSLLERGHVFESISVGMWWPLVPIALGVARIRRDGTDGQDNRGGWMLLALGIWGLIVVVTPISFAETWPLVLLVWGASTVWSGLGEQRHAG